MAKHYTLWVPCCATCVHNCAQVFRCRGVRVDKGLCSCQALLKGMHCNTKRLQGLEDEKPCGQDLSLIKGNRKEWILKGDDYFTLTIYLGGIQYFFRPRDAAQAS